MGLGLGGQNQKSSKKYVGILRQIEFGDGGAVVFNHTQRCGLWLEMPFWSGSRCVWRGSSVNSDCSAYTASRFQAFFVSYSIPEVVVRSGPCTGHGVSNGWNLLGHPRPVPVPVPVPVPRQPTHVRHTGTPSSVVRGRYVGLRQLCNVCFQYIDIRLACTGWLILNPGARQA